MATTSKVLYRGAATTTTSTVLYTVPSATTTVVTSIVVSNTGAATDFTLSLGGFVLAQNVTVGAYDSTVIDLKQTLVATNTITGGASATTINFHISGVEIA